MQLSDSVVPGTTLRDVLDQNKSNPHGWSLAIPLLSGYGFNYPLSAWYNFPIIQVFMSLPALMVNDSNGNHIDVVSGNESSRMLLKQNEDLG
jgi:hypothetical protein